jgi:membrane-associated phospholipid phosphatase
MLLSPPCFRDESHREQPIDDARSNQPSRSKAKVAFRSFDTFFVCLLLSLTFPALKIAHLPFQFDLAALIKAYLSMFVGAIFMAVLFAVVGLPWGITVAPLLGRLRKIPLLLLVTVNAAITIWALGFVLGVVVFIDGLALIELLTRRKDRVGSSLLDILIPAFYLLCGLIAVFAFNHAFVAIRYGGTYDAAFRRLDNAIFHTGSYRVSQWCLDHLPRWVFELENFAYFSIWSRVGAFLVLCGVLGGRKHAMELVRALLLGYAIALLVFLAVPAKGPYSIHPVKAPSYAQSLGAFETQKVLTARMKELWAHHLTPDVRDVGVGDYYVSFPSLHAAIPLIAIWFLRRWRRISLVALGIYGALLLPSLILLEWHYIVDVFGGFGVALLTIWLSGRISGGWTVRKRTLKYPPVPCPSRSL